MTHADERMTLMEHLGELRKRLFIAAAGLVVCMVVAAIFNDRVFALLVHPLPPNLKQITTFSPAEPFLVSLQVWLYAGIIVAAPLMIYEFWAFVGPAFTPGERKHILPVVGICTLLFLGGVVFGYLLVLPRGLNFLLSWNSQFFDVKVRAQDYLSFAAWFLVAFGAVFEMPVLIVAAVYTGLTDVRWLRKHRRGAIVINAIVAAVATPSQDAFSMLAMFIPLVVLYEIAIVLAAIMVRRRKQTAADASEGEPPDDGDGGVSPTPA